jgi:hypothetical protein
MPASLRALLHFEGSKPSRVRVTPHETSFRAQPPNRSPSVPHLVILLFLLWPQAPAAAQGDGDH